RPRGPPAARVAGPGNDGCEPRRPAAWRRPPPPPRLPRETSPAPHRRGLSPPRRRGSRPRRATGDRAGGGAVRLPPRRGAPATPSIPPGRSPGSRRSAFPLLDVKGSESDEAVGLEPPPEPSPSNGSRRAPIDGQGTRLAAGRGLLAGYAPLGRGHHRPEGRQRADPVDRQRCEGQTEVGQPG